KKVAARVDLVSSGGHQVQFDGRRIYPENFLLRHYIALSAAHACRKYGAERVYSKKEIIDLGWHGERARFSSDRFRLPLPDALKLFTGRIADFDRSDLKTKHLLFIGQPSGEVTSA